MLPALLDSDVAQGLRGASGTDEASREMTDDLPLIIFTPSGQRGNMPKGITILDAAKKLGVDVDSVCGGRGICGRCQIKPTFGEFPKHGITSNPSDLSPMSETEANYRGQRPLENGRRLSCASSLYGNLVVDVPAESQLHQQIVRKDINISDFELDPVLVLRVVELDYQKDLISALEEQWGLVNLQITSDIKVVSDDSGLATVAIRDGCSVVACWAGFQDRALGVAIDIGSTTVAGYLFDLTTGELLATEGRMNPQIRFGEDLMSRVSYAMLNSGGALELTESLREALDELLGQLCQKAEADRAEVLEAVLVGNPIMHHLLLGLDPTPLGQAPFSLEISSAIDRDANTIGLTSHSATRAHVLPCVAGHVGADTAAVILSCRTYEPRGIQLVIDIGTNAEIVLSGKGRLLAASSPTGPAFEGAQIEAGQRATPGAIERVRIDPDNGEPRIKVLGTEVWSDEPNFDEIVAKTGVTGICGSGIIEAVAELYLAELMSPDGVIGGAGTRPSPRIEPNGRTFAYILHTPPTGPRILITQNDIRAIQLAKSALYAGVRLLMDRLDVEKVDGIALAGAFGSHIDTLRATVLGLIPDCKPTNVKAVGNAAGVGAAIALLSGNERQKIQDVVKTIEKIETAMEPSFQTHFIDAMPIPHRTADYPYISSILNLPERSFLTTNSSKSRKHRHQTERETRNE